MKKKMGPVVRFGIRYKILVGFTSIFLILFITSLLTLVELKDSKHFYKKLSQKDLPTFTAVQSLKTGMEASLASLRGWMLMGQTNYKAERATAWQKIETDTATINTNSQLWQDSKLISQWKQINNLLGQLKIAQDKIERVANTNAENQPLSLLKTQGVPNYTKVLSLITRMIASEKQQTSGAKRKALLANMADFRAGIATGVSDMRLYVIEGHPDLIVLIQQKMKAATLAEKNIAQSMQTLTLAQRNAFIQLQPIKATLFTVMNNIINLRQKKDWNLANYLLVTTAAPIAENIQTLLGSLNVKSGGGLIPLLHQNIEHDMQELNKDLDLLTFTQWVALLLGMLLTLLITWVTSRSIVNPIQSAINIAKQIATGERELDITVVGRDETAVLLSALNEMHEGITDAESKLKYSEAKVQKLLEELESRIKEYRNFIAAVTKGDLTQTLQVSGDDDLAKLGEHLNQMTQGLTSITSQIITATNEMSTGLNQLESAATSQAASASEQASSVAEVSSVVEEIKATSQQTLEKASMLGDTAEKTHQEGERGQQAVVAMSSSMQNLEQKIGQIADTILSLSEQTQQIGEITGAVSDIAKQSKMLALNASIEAAKAGEAGKGFAVVAGEVKELAEKSQSSTERVQKILQEIKQTAERAVMVTEEGTKSVQAGKEQANQTGGIVSALGSVIEQSSTASQQIVAAVRQETAGIEQVVVSIGEIDKVTNQFSSATEETKQASVNLATVLKGLKESISVYKLTNEKDSNGNG